MTNEPGVSADHPPPSDASAPPTLERELIEAVLRKDRKAAAAFVSAHADAVYGYIRHRLAPRIDMVDDLVQDVFVAAFTGLSAFREMASLRSWLLGIARHKVEDYYRHQLREVLTTEADETVPLVADERSVEEHIDRSRAAARTQRILSQLPESYGIVLLWRYWESRSVREMAAATGRTEKAIERLLARARTRFRELWERDRT